MTEIALTRMSSKGQIVIPKSIREGLAMRPGDVFALFGEEGTLILKKIPIPNEDEFRVLLAWGEAFAREQGITRENVEDAISEAREERSE